MRRRAIIRHDVSSPEEMAEIYGIPVSRVKFIERLLLRSQESRAAQKGASKKDNRGKIAKKPSAKKTQ